MVRVNFAELSDFSKLEQGKYHFAVTDVDLKEGTEKEPDSEAWNVELTVQDGEKEGQKEFVWIGLPPHYEPYALKPILKATVGQHNFTLEEVESGEIDVEMDDLLGLEFVATVKPNKKNSDFNDLRNYEPYDSDEWDSDENLLP